MEFKIDTKATYVIIMPMQQAIDAILADKLVQKVEELRQSGSNNFIVDLSLGAEIDAGAMERLLKLHVMCYEAGQSLVFGCVGEGLRRQVLALDEDRVLQLAPTLIEAVDIVSMEILERELMEEDPGGPEL